MIPVLVPWRAGDPARVRAWRFVSAFWEELGYPVVTGDVVGPFSRSAARNEAARRAGAWDVAILADADTVMRDRHSILQALELVETTGRVVVPHDEYVGLSDTGSRQVIGGRQEGWRRIARQKPGAPLGIVVVPRAGWDRLGGFDERFTTWGGEDTSFMHAARTLVGVSRLPGVLYHLWHPVDAAKPGYLARPPALVARYREASGDPVAMAAILAEREEVAA